MIKILVDIFKQPKYVVGAIFVALFIILITIWLPNFQLLKHTITSEAFDASVKSKIVWSGLGAFRTNQTVYAQIISVTIATLAGINISMMMYYFKKRIAVQKVAQTSALGIIGGFLGVGCSACGSVLLSSIFGIAATGSFIGALPLKGSEFGLIGIALILVSSYIILKKLSSPFVCDTSGDTIAINKGSDTINI